MTVFARALLDPDGDTSDNTTCDNELRLVRAGMVWHGRCFTREQRIQGCVARHGNAQR